MDHPDVNIISLTDPGVALTRVYSAKYFRKALNDRCLTLVKPEAWDDPFENILLKCSVRTLDGRTISLNALRGTLYAQSWSLLHESDAMWRIYSDDRHGIKVETTAGKLIELCRRRGRRANLYSIGCVQYLSEEQLVSWLTGPGGAQRILTGDSVSDLARSLLVKRDAFGHEKEVRLIYREFDISRARRRRVHTMKIRPNDLFSRIVLDPRLQQSECRRLENRIRQWGYEGEVVQSSLYASRTFLVKLKATWAVTSHVHEEG